MTDRLADQRANARDLDGHVQTLHSPVWSATSAYACNAHGVAMSFAGVSILDASGHYQQHKYLAPCAAVLHVSLSMHSDTPVIDVAIIEISIW